MIGANASGVARRDEVSVVTASTAAKWLSFAAAPTFAIMAMLTVVNDNSLPTTFCMAAGGSWPGGMAPMYFLMAAFHLAPWLRLFSRQGSAARNAEGATLFAGVNRSSYIQTVEPKR